MAIFNYVSELGGSDKPFIAKIKLKENVDVEKGELLYFDETACAVTPNKGSLTIVAGVCAKTYKAEASDLVPDYGLGVVEVNISPDSLYRVPGCIIQDNAGDTADALLTSISGIDMLIYDGYTGGKLMLVEKASDSTNPFPIGRIFDVISMEEIRDKAAFLVSENMKSSKGDKFMFIPRYGFTELIINNNNNLVFQFKRKGDFFVVAADKNGYIVKIKNIHCDLDE